MQTAEIKKKVRKHQRKGNMKEMEEKTYGDGGGWSRHQDKC